MNIVQRFLMLLLVISCAVTGLHAQEMIKRTVVVLPFYNRVSHKGCDYLSDTMRDAVVAELIKTQNFNIVLSSKVDTKIEQLGLDPKSLAEDDTARNIALELAADVVVFGKFIIVDDKVKILAFALDILAEQMASGANEQGSTGVEIFTHMNTIARNMAKDMVKKLQKVDKSLIEQLLNRQSDVPSDSIVIEESNMDIINSLISKQGNRYSRYVVNRGNKKRLLAVPKFRNVIIFIRDASGDFTVESQNNRYIARNGIKMVVFDNQPGTKREFIVTKEGYKPFKYTYIQKKDNDIIVVKIAFSDDKEVNYYTFFIDNSLSFSTSGTLLYEFKIGLGLPVYSKLKNNIYFNFGIGPKLLNFTSDLYQNPHLRLNFAFGYEHVFYVRLTRNFLAFHVGGEVGVELNFFSHLSKDGLVLNTLPMNLPLIFGYPSIYLSIPLQVELLASRKVSVLIGLSPRLRFTFNYFLEILEPVKGTYEGRWWNDDMNGLTDRWLAPFHQKVSNSLYIDLFLYDMPITIGARIKL